MIITRHLLIRAAFFLIVISIYCVFLGAPVAVAGSKGWLAFGDLRGSLEPCGCDPSTDLGGIKRLITAIGRERLLKPDLGVFSLGNTLEYSAENKIKNKFLIKGMSLIRPDATLFNVQEIAYIEWLDQWFAKDTQIIRGQNYVLSNLQKRGHRPWIAELVRNSEYLVFGYTFDPRLARLVEPVSESMLMRWRKRIQLQSKSLSKVLLFSGPSADLEQFQKSGLFDIIVSSHTAALDEVPSTKDKDDETRLIRLGNGDHSSIWMVPLAGQGYLRGGDLLNREGASLEQVFSQGHSGIRSLRDHADLELGKAFRRPKTVSWLLGSTGENQVAQVLYAEYMQATKSAFDKLAEIRAKDLRSSPFAGTEACQSCHPAEVEKFKLTKHFHAMETLLRKGKDQDSECVICHSVGASVKGGFVSLKLSPNLAGVQCENCHGPRKAHIENPVSPSKTSADPFKSCIACHNSQHSPKFQQEDYWRMIEHGQNKPVKTQEKSGR